VSGSTALVVAEKPHSELGASVAARWMNCPGSIQLARGLPPLPTSVFAEEGTAAHALGELSLRKGVDPETFIGATLEGVEVTEEMADFVRVYVDHCRTFDEPHVETAIEKRFNLSKLNPPGPMYGTADFVWSHPESGSMGIVDLKYGSGIVVEVKGNKQLRYYALGAVLDMPWIPDTVTMTIVQPRVTHPDGVVRSETITIEELTEFGTELLEAARRTQDPDAPRVPGSWCRYCPATGQCPEQRDQALAVAQSEFGVIDAPPDPATLPPEVFAEIYNKLPILRDWIKAVDAVAMAKLERGLELPGYKLVAKRPTRAWKDPDETEQWLKAEGRIDAEIFVQKLKSPAQIEKLVGKKNLPADLYEKRSSGYTMAPDHDPRPPISISAGEEFGVISAPSGTTNPEGRDENIDE
jgi:hypothetical protein